MKIKSALRRHGKFQVEIDNNFSINSNSQKSEIQHIDTYIFFPRSLNVTAERFNKEIIYRHLQRVFRLKASSNFLTDLYATGDHYMQELQNHLQQVPCSHKKIILRFKLFICAYESALKKRKNRVIAAIKNNCCDDVFEDFFKQVSIYSRHFRELQKDIPDDYVQEHFNFFDEYLSYVIRSSSLKLLKVLKKDCESASQAVKKLEDLLIYEYEYAESKNYPLPIEGSSNRKYIYRIKGILKKNIWDVLYLDVKRKEDAQFFTHLLYGFAAGMAMIFATLVAFFAQQHYGNYSWPLFAALVIGYIFKDRLKELLKDFFKNSIDARTFDKKTDVFSHDQIKLGTLQERIYFIEKNQLSSDILNARELHREASVIRENLEDESVICYNKRLKLSHKLFNTNYSDLISDGIKSITRIDLSPFIMTMDNSKHFALSLNTKSRKVEKISCLRTYQITILLHYRSRQEKIIERFRVVISRDGVHSIEKRL